MKKISLAGIAKKKDSGKTEYPVLPDPNGKAAEAAAQILKEQEEFEALEGSLKNNKKFLIELATPYHFQFAHMKALDKSVGILVETRPDDKGLVRKVRLDFKDSYAKLDDERPLLPILGDRTGELFHQSFEFKIDGDKLPADKAEEIVGELMSLFAKHNASDALTVKEGIAPVASFHLQRHLILTPEENIALQQVCPIRAAVALKNVK